MSLSGQIGVQLHLHVHWHMGATKHRFGKVTPLIVMGWKRAGGEVFCLYPFSGLNREPIGWVCCGRKVGYPATNEVEYGDTLSGEGVVAISGDWHND